MGKFRDFYARAQAQQVAATRQQVEAREARYASDQAAHRANVRQHHAARVNNGFREAVDDVRHKLVEEAWFGRQTTGDLPKEEVPEIGPAPEAPQGAAPIADTSPIMHDTKFSYADWYRRQNPTGEPVSEGSIHGETRAGDAKAADLYGKTPGVETTSKGEAQYSDLYGPSKPTAEPPAVTPPEPAPAAAPEPPQPDHEPGY